jgi:uncharacterized membrane protein
MTLGGRPIAIDGLPLPSDAAWFLALIAVHVAAGLTCVVAGAVAMLSPKAAGRHPTAGVTYVWALGVVAVTMAVVSAFRWAEDAHLFALGSASFLAALLGRLARRRGRLRLHASGMAASYILLITAFYVDNGPHLPLWRRLPPPAFWILPCAIGLPILAWALARHALLRRGATSPGTPERASP